MKNTKGITVSKCIYCQSLDDNSREHVIPNALLSRIPNEAWVIQKGSCVKCQKILSVIESDIINNLYKTIRPALELKKGRIDAFVVNEKKLFSPDVYIICNIIFQLPTLLLNIKAVDGPIRIRKVSVKVLDPLQMLYRELINSDIGKYQIGEMNIGPANLMKFLSKIAYGFCVINFGESFYNRSELPQIILGLSNEKLGKFVGSITQKEEEMLLGKQKIIKTFNTKYHEVQLIEYNYKVIVKIKIFHINNLNTESCFIVIAES